jgi:predicted RNase H-like nuclease (RuvC/YqgF family)
VTDRAGEKPDQSDDIEDLRQELADTKALAKQAMQYAGEMADRADDLEDEVHRLQKRVDQLEDQERLFQDVRQAMQATPEERAVVLVKALNNEALTNEQLGDPAAAGMTIDAARSTLGGTLGQQQLHDAMDEAVRLAREKEVGDDVLRKQTGTPGRGGKKTKLLLDLDAGSLPETIAGEPIPESLPGGAN